MSDISCRFLLVISWAAWGLVASWFTPERIEKLRSLRLQMSTMIPASRGRSKGICSLMVCLPISGGHVVRSTVGHRFDLTCIASLFSMSLKASPPPMGRSQVLHLTGMITESRTMQLGSRSCNTRIESGTLYRKSTTSGFHL
jgi:hypothetical protein